MSTTTTNFSLFKYDPSTDGNTSFSITNALNNNWDKLDANCVRRLSTTAATGNATTPVYVDAQGKIQSCNAYSTIPSGLTATTSLAENGYIKFSTDIIIVWGKIGTQATTKQTIVYPITFSRVGALASNSSYNNSSYVGGNYLPNTPTNTGFTINTHALISTTWVAVGY